ncbi:AraC family transcriptional regulator [Bradyrhizobium forestalis]|uniref:AraC family transcriptional regulator n=1 Tax=Bradyrhizobium forestalis TaxID=1419263 RepID=A0A2M8R2K2_9BRAD|nr:helix-turn-helix transcriptional regulator [Bradyrhizobium forestalis]PJG52043.1 AraC family transcriptional regulator [Bradyrhizobium forestalis]
MSEDFAPLLVSTAALPDRDRLPFWREVFGRKMVRLDIEPLSEAPFEADSTLRVLPGLRTMTWRMRPAARFLRTPELIADADDSVGLLLNLVGDLSLSHCGREASLGEKDAIAVLHGEPAAVCFRNAKAAVVVPRAGLAPLVANIEDAAMRVIPRESDALRLLTGYLKMVHEGLPLATPELRQRVAVHVLDLVAMAIGATRDGAAIAAERGVRAARLVAVKADIAARLDRRDLGLAAVAARQQVTPRYVQMLFESEGITFSQFVLEQRMTRAYQMLTSPRYAGWTISAIALAAGFGDLSHFNRSFRRRYGVTPSDARCAGHPPR